MFGFFGTPTARSRCTNNGSPRTSSVKWTKNVLARFTGLVILLTTAEINMERIPDIGDIVIPAQISDDTLKLGIIGV